MLSNATLDEVWYNGTYGTDEYGFKGDYFRESEGPYTANAKIAKVSANCNDWSYCCIQLSLSIFTCSFVSVLVSASVANVHEWLLVDRPVYIFIHVFAASAVQHRFLWELHLHLIDQKTEGVGSVDTAHDAKDGP